ncbi:MAG: DoxX family protein [Inquilinaceae bacterium]
MTVFKNGTSKPAAPRWKTWTLWGLQIVAALAFFAAGGSKLAGVEPMVALFDQIGFGQWFRYLTGLLEVTGAALILHPRTAMAGGALLACVMIGAVLTHLVLIGGSPVPALILLLITGSVAWMRRARA